MTTKAKVKAVKAPAINATAIAREIGVNLGIVDGALNATQKIKEGIKALREAKIKIGASSRTCAVAQAIYDGMPESLTVATKRQYLSGIRQAVNDGKAFDTNASKKAGKGAKRGANTKGKAKTSALVAIDKNDTSAQAEVKLRKFFNAVKKEESGFKSVPLMSFLIDALDDAKEKKFNPLAK
jgi:hypothetical protein